MAVTKEETLVYSSKTEHRYSRNHSQNLVPACRLANHQLSAQRVEIEDIKHNDDDTKLCIANQYVFLVICHDCCREWTELWTTSKWFIQNNNKNSNY